MNLVHTSATQRSLMSLNVGQIGHLVCWLCSSFNTLVTFEADFFFKGHTVFFGENNFGIVISFSPSQHFRGFLRNFFWEPHKSSLLLLLK